MLQEEKKTGKAQRPVSRRILPVNIFFETGIYFLR